ncbi:MAG TPA: A/G-specific adenine glycosylase [Tepidisphaeraceae bacterium]|nr:A/G-specific adenine glycosylase [Tepidisphaeraceae bacterium]
MLSTAGRFRRRLLDWYATHRRDLPWRSANGKLPDPYRVLVSEFMLQQTQVTTVIPYFNRFLGDFPNVRALADSDEQHVLRLWQGLGYYSRARNLRNSCCHIVQHFNGEIPRDVGDLRSLPGIGRYTAGAIASIAFGKTEPLVDGNVARVICRLDLIRDDPKNSKTVELLWDRARELVSAEHPGDFNSAMMELGATVCMPKNPDCGQCPVRSHCQAVAAGMQGKIPASKKSRPTPLESRITLCVERNGRWLIEQRPPTGRWASLWQFTTFPTALIHPKLDQRKLEKLGTIRHTLTHRRYEFTAYRCRAGVSIPAGKNRKWVRAAELSLYPMSKPQCQIARMLELD